MMRKVPSMVAPPECVTIASGFVRWDAEDLRVSTVPPAQYMVGSSFRSEAVVVAWRRNRHHKLCRALTHFGNDRGDKRQCLHLWICSCLGDDRPSVTLPHKDRRSVRISSMRLVATTSPASEVCGSCTIVTLNASLISSS